MTNKVKVAIQTIQKAAIKYCKSIRAICCGKKKEVETMVNN